MKHVFVETNFLIELLRPFPSKEAGTFAVRLLNRADSGELTLHLPWCSVVEAKRTLSDKIREDLGFIDTMMQFVVAAFTTGTARFDKREIDKLKTQAEAARKKAYSTVKQRVDEVAAKTSLVRPTEAVINRTLQIFEVKSLKPFDEMVLGAVLQKASELYADGYRDLWFCNLNKNDFKPSGLPVLDDEYKACGLRYLDSFDVP